MLHLHRHQQLFDFCRVTLFSRHLGLSDLLHDALVPSSVLSEEHRDLSDRLDVAVHVLALDVDATMGRLVDLLDLGLLLRLPHRLHHLLLLLLGGRHATKVLLIDEHLLRLLVLQTHLGVVHLCGPLLLLALIESLLTGLVPRLNRHLHVHRLARSAWVLLMLAAHRAIALVA